MSTLAERFAAAVDTMHGLPTPSRVLRRILADPVDTGLRAANLDGKVRGGSPESHPERMAETPARPPGGRHVADMIQLRNSSTAVVESTIGMLDLCLYRSPAADDYGWADALRSRPGELRPGRQALAAQDRTPALGRARRLALRARR